MAVGRATAVAATAVLVLGASACGSGVAGTGAAPVASVSVAPTVKDCGTVTLSQGVSPKAALGCVLVASRDATPAHLMLTLPTVEGDPVVMSYLVLADGTVEVVEDDRADRFGGSHAKAQLWRKVCPRQLDVTVADVAGCPEPTAIPVPE